jgi:hypothetical protein
MFLRLAVMIGAVSQALFASDFSPTLFANQNTGTLRDLNRQALNRQIRLSLLGKQPAGKSPLPSIQANPLLSGRAKMGSGSDCSIPLAQMKIDNTKRFIAKSFKTAKPNFDPLAKTAPLPACEH